MNTRMGRLAPMVVVPAMVLAMAGCSGDDNEGDAGDKASATDSPTPSETTSTPSTVSPSLRTPPTLEDSSGGVNDIEWDPASCKTEKGVQTVEGTVTNPSRRPLDYVITVSWTNATSDTLGLGYVTVKDAPSKKETAWKLRGRVPDNVTQCVINVVRGQLPAQG